jgi:SHAQKYF class myb-like DNA-binding protein
MNCGSLNSEGAGDKKTSKKKRKEGSFNTGRWMPEEHQRFIEALLKFGNDWKNVQKYVGSRSSTQARSHAQKFFVKIGKTQIENLNLDFENNSLKSLNLMANNLNPEQMCKAIKFLNEMAFDKKNSGKRINSAGTSSNLSKENFNSTDYPRSEHGLEIFIENEPSNLNTASKRISIPLTGAKRYLTIKLIL